jgi:hypothetical protein
MRRIFSILGEDFGGGIGGRLLEGFWGKKLCF